MEPSARRGLGRVEIRVGVEPDDRQVAAVPGVQIRDRREFPAARAADRENALRVGFGNRVESLPGARGN
jgi:hypothetical protein